MTSLLLELIIQLEELSTPYWYIELFSGTVLNGKQNILNSSGKGTKFSSFCAELFKKIKMFAHS